MTKVGNHYIDRTIGSDKLFPVLHIEAEKNPLKTKFSIRCFYVVK